MPVEDTIIYLPPNSMEEPSPSIAYGIRSLVDGSYRKEKENLSRGWYPRTRRRNFWRSSYLGEFTMMTRNSSSKNFLLTHRHLANQGLATAAIFTLSAVYFLHAKMRTSSLHISSVSSLSTLRKVLKAPPPQSGIPSVKASKWTSTHTAIFTNETNPNFCKTLYSALASGYDPPHLIHLHQEITHGHGEKIFDYDAYLQDLQIDDKTLVLLVDAFDVWFQLPEVIARHRFTQLGTELLVGADKKCWPNQPESKACSAWPESDMAKDVYGDLTDFTLKKNAANLQYEFARPRWLNSGTIMGTRTSLRKLFEKAAIIARAREDESFHDQEVLADVLADDSLDIDFKVDSLSHVFQTLTFAHQDISWEVNPDPRSAPSSPYDAGSGKETESTIYLPDAIELGLPDSDTRNNFWRDRPILRNKLSNTLPALLHFNGRKGFLVWWWKRMWFTQGKTRGRLLQLFREESAPGMAGAWDGNSWLSYQDLCGSYDLFKD